MFKISKKKTEFSNEVLVKTIRQSTLLAMIFSLPGLGIFLGIYYTTGNLVVGVVLGFGIHFVTLAFSDRISKRLLKVLS